MLHIAFRQIQGYIGPSFLRHVMSQVYLAICTTLDILRHTCPDSGIFWVYFASVILVETLTCLVSFRHYSRAIYGYSELYFSRFRHI